MPKATYKTETRARLISSAERLFAERGIDGVSLREINVRSGARDVYALQYHFKDRSGLLQAVVDKHLIGIEEVRNRMLDEYEANDTPNIRLLGLALVQPLAAKLSDPNSGRDFLIIYADLLNRRRPHIGVGVIEDEHNSLYRWSNMLTPLLPHESVRYQRRFKAVLMTAIELSRRARDAERSDDSVFISDLVDTVCAILEVESSEETLRLAAARRRTRD